MTIQKNKILRKIINFLFKQMDLITPDRESIYQAYETMGDIYYRLSSGDDYENDKVSYYFFKRTFKKAEREYNRTIEEKVLEELRWHQEIDSKRTLEEAKKGGGQK